MKPIEPGCLCLSLSPQFPGQCVAKFFAPAGSMFPTPDDSFFTTSWDGWSCDFPDLDFPAMIATRQLLRIDGGEHDELTTSETKECKA